MNMTDKADALLRALAKLPGALEVIGGPGAHQLRSAGMDAVIADDMMAEHAAALATIHELAGPVAAAFLLLTTGIDDAKRRANGPLAETNVHAAPPAPRRARRPTQPPPTATSPAPNQVPATSAPPAADSPAPAEPPANPVPAPTAPPADDKPRWVSGWRFRPDQNADTGEIAYGPGESVSVWVDRGELVIEGPLDPERVPIDVVRRILPAVEPLAPDAEDALHHAIKVERDAINGIAGLVGKGHLVGWETRERIGQIVRDAVIGLVGATAPKPAPPADGQHLITLPAKDVGLDRSALLEIMAVVGAEPAFVHETEVKNVVAAVRRLAATTPPPADKSPTYLEVETALRLAALPAETPRQTLARLTRYEVTIHKL
jgi:hypothetical protein